MSDQSVVPSGSHSPTEAPTAGMMLRQAREAAGLHVAALAVSLKVPVRKLEALEADRFDDLPDAVFVRALAAGVCRTLKVDPAPILGKLPQSATPKLEHTERGVRMPVQGSSLFSGNSPLAWLTRPAVLWVAVLLLAALAVAVFPEARTSVVGIPQATKTEPAAAQASGPQADAAAAPAAVSPVSAVAAADKPALAVSSTLPAVAAPITAPASVPVVATAAAADSAGSAAAPAVASGLVVFKAQSRAWIRVTDGKGVIQFEKTLAVGESAGASGALPLSVIVGNAAATEVLVRGQPFSLEGVTQNNVARFEVK